jgi:hypothetical protein
LPALRCRDVAVRVFLVRGFCMQRESARTGVRAVTDVAAVGRAVLANLEAQRERQREAVEALRDDIHYLLESDVGPEHGRAKRIRDRLPWRIRPSLRAVQRHLAVIRADQSECRDE